jgi:hypothetical protein
MTDSKAYPYPILRTWVDDYSDSSFSLEDLQLANVNGETVITIQINLENDYLNEQILDSKAGLAIEINCRDTLLSRWIPLSSFSTEIRFGSGEIAGKFSAQAFLVSLVNRDDFQPDGINHEFNQKVFNIRQGDPLAISFVQDSAVNFSRKSQGDSLIVRHVENMGPYEYSIDTTGDAIVISTGDKTHYYYQALVADQNSKTHLFQSVYKDAVVFAIAALAENPENADLAWGQSLIGRISALGKVIPNFDDLENINLLALQIVGPDGIGKVRNSAN